MYWEKTLNKEVAKLDEVVVDVSAMEKDWEKVKKVSTSISAKLGKLHIEAEALPATTVMTYLTDQGEEVVTYKGTKGYIIDAEDVKIVAGGKSKLYENYYNVVVVIGDFFVCKATFNRKTGLLRLKEQLFCVIS